MPAKFLRTAFNTLAVLSFVLLSVLHAGQVRAATLVIGLAADVSSLDPHFLNVASNVAMSSHFFDTLVTTDADGKLIPALAESWRTLSPTVWEFKLRKDVKFQDGSPLTADDVVFSLERPATILNSPGPFTPYVKQIVSRQIMDAHTLRLTTAQPYGPLLLDLSSIFIVSKKAAQGKTTEDFNTGRALIGTGPFRFVKFQRGERIEAVRNEYYWGPRPVWDKVTFRILTAEPARLAALLSGQVDLIEGAPPADLPRLRKDARFRLEQRPSWRTLFLQLDHARDASPDITDNNGKPLGRNPLKDLRVRRALSKAIQRQALTERTLEGLGIPAANLVAPGILGHNDNLRPEAYDPEGARRLLAEAGWPNGFGLTLHGPNNRYINDDQILQTIAQFFSRIGIKTRVETLPLSVYFGRLRNADFSIGLLGWGSLAGDVAAKTLVGTPDPAIGWGSWNWGRYSNPRVDGLIRDALATTDPSRRRRLAQAADTAALEDLAMIPLHHEIATWAMRRNLRYPPRIDEFTFAWQVRPE
ncbi:MAG: ABC transporter substrate-binding protein [Proteobacteria bacterium]|nr:ABC transporter substrate-binding protein [Pseudomonadota bacterium]